jgi:hypothetical protein
VEAQAVPLVMLSLLLQAPILLLVSVLLLCFYRSGCHAIENMKKKGT